MSDFYKVLGVSQKADSARIKSAFRALALACHPDQNGGDKRAELRFKEIGRAYETLGNSLMRAQYDAKRAQERAKARRYFMSAAATMAASFLLTVSSGLLVGMWLI